MSGTIAVVLVGGWRLEVGGWRLEVGGWRLEVGGWRLGVGGWGLEVGSFGLPTVESYHAVERSIKTMPLNRFCNIVDFF
jgi:hypothetical protein